MNLKFDGAFATFLVVPNRRIFFPLTRFTTSLFFMETFTKPTEIHVEFLSDINLAVSKRCTTIQ